MEGEKKKILIVDDDNFILDMYALKFNQNNFEVYTAENGAQAIEKIKDGLSPLVMLIDVIMPEMDGFEMLEKINAEKLSPNSIKIILSNKNEQKDVERGNILIEFGDNFSAFIYSNISKPSISGIITSISITSGESPSLIFSIACAPFSAV